MQRSRHSSRGWQVLLALCLLLPAAGASAAPEKMPDGWFYPDKPDAYKKMEGKPAPRLSLDGFINGDSFSNADLKGKITVVDIWATWCGPCIAAIPKNNQISKKYADQGVQVIGVTTSQGQEKLPELVEKHKIEYLVATDPGQKTGKAWSVAFFPTYAIVDREGIVRGIGIAPSHVEDAVKMILEEQPKPEEVAGAEGAEPISTASPQPGQENEAAADLEEMRAAIKPEWLEGDAQLRQRLDGLMEKAPKLSVENWMNADGMSGGQFPEGTRVVLLDFWATWCGPCIAAIPHTNELMDKYADKGLVIVGVCHPRGVEKMGQTVQEKGIRFPVAADKDGETAKAFAVNGFPDYYLLDADGNVIAADVANGAVDDALEALLGD